MLKIIPRKAISTATAEGFVLAEGKTKTIVRHGEDQVYIVSKDDITAGDGAKHDTFKGKAVAATTTTCNVFRLLKRERIPVAFIEQIDDVTFKAPLCTMLPYKVVVRREAHGSFLKRNPYFEKGHRFEDAVVEFFLKTSGKKWGEHELPCDDPLMIYVPGSGSIDLYLPSAPMETQQPFLTLRERDVFSTEQEHRRFADMEHMAVCALSILEQAWEKLGIRLVDFKVEFGLSPQSRLLYLADVIDNDSWRLVGPDGAYLDKQRYRDGDELENVQRLYEHVAELTNQF